MPSARILVAEDDDCLRQLLADTLRGDGHQVLEVSRGDELLHALIAMHDRGVCLDLVLSDVAMPGISGLDALELARAAEPSLPIVLMTGQDEATLVARAGRINVSCILRKPFNFQALRAVVISLLS